MKKNCNAVFLLAVVIISYNLTPQQLSGQSKKVSKSTKQNIGKDITNDTDKAELVDRTVKENIYKKPTYDGGNGAVIKYTKRNGITTCLRLFKCEFLVDAYVYEENQFLYKDHDDKEIVSPFENNTKLTSSQIYVTKSRDNNIECWIKVTDPKGNIGWVYGEEDPYRDNNWIAIGTVHVENKSILIRKYVEWFSIQGGEPAYDRPSYSGKIIWHTERTDDNSQINLESICVTDDLNRGDYYRDPSWVKAKDSYGRIGWFPGDKLDIERGGFNFLSPENITAQIFVGYD